MFKLAIVLALACFAHSLPTQESETRNVQIITRAQWGARAPNSRTTLATPVPEVIIHHSFSPGACWSQSACATAMRSMQNHHMNTNGWADIGYNFAVGSDGLVYEGRGWTTQGAHAPAVNSRSIGICLIGNWSTTSPPAVQLTATQNLINMGMSNGRIQRAHWLRGHRQVTATDCPGNTLFNTIRSWPNFRA
ncbi:peptidoglycan-recognition protein SC2-like [Hyposmocoma kahamanoa]|uniref:peptidoglycan-recognition protein SC2-like n=1 Tax=Hyposmocoma kahamanoa TaxID=1477025 RepID=UPI000E6D7214|nr:peptidoglycan-recognition protein SC2-like [Hyposmocoma kahamanoa]